MPAPEVALPCGSASTSNTLLPHVAITAARLTAVVVFPTPPFWFATAIILAIYLPRNLTHSRSDELQPCCPPDGFIRQRGMFHVSRSRRGHVKHRPASRLPFVVRTRTPIT